MKKTRNRWFFFVFTLFIVGCGEYHQFQQQIVPFSPVGAEIIYCDENKILHHLRITGENGSYTQEPLLVGLIQGRFPFVIWPLEKIGFISERTNSLWLINKELSESQQALPNKGYINYYPNQEVSFSENNIAYCNWDEDRGCWNINIFDIILGQSRVVRQSSKMPDCPIFLDPENIAFRSAGQGIIKLNIFSLKESFFSPREGFLFLVGPKIFISSFENEILDLNNNQKVTEGTMGKPVPGYNDLFLFKNQGGLYKYDLGSNKIFKLIDPEESGIQVKYFDINRNGEVVFSTEDSLIFWTTIWGHPLLPITYGDMPCMMARE